MTARRSISLPELCGALLLGGALTWAPHLGAQLAPGPPADSLVMELVVEGLTQPTDVVAVGGKVIVVQRMGDVAVLSASGELSEIANHINVVPLNAEQGLLGVVADPEYAENGTLYFYASAGDVYTDKHQVLKAQLSADNVLGPTEKILDQGLVGFQNHAGGGLFIHERQLYLSVGDAGANATPPYNQWGTCLNSPNGKILRINLDGSIPDDNPLVGIDTVTGCDWFNKPPLKPMPPDTRIYAWGLRNPFRFSIDAETGLLWIGDVGEKAREEISVGGKGDHFGWPFMEGTVQYTQKQQPFQPDGSCQGVVPASECVVPAYEYPHTSSRNTVIGGPLLNICGWPAAWRDRYLFADYGAKQLWTMQVNSTRDGLVPDTVEALASVFGGPASLRIGDDGAVYVVDVNAGSVWRIRPQMLTNEVCQAPIDGMAGAAGVTNAGQSAGGVDVAGGAPSENQGGLGEAPSGAAGEAEAASGGDGSGDPATRNDDSGCGCRVAVEQSEWCLAALAGLLGLAALRRRGWDPTSGGRLRPHR